MEKCIQPVHALCVAMFSLIERTFVRKINMHNDPVSVFDIPGNHPANGAISQPRRDVEIDKKGHIEGRHVLRSDVDWTNTRKWFFVLSQSAGQSFST